MKKAETKPLLIDYQEMSAEYGLKKSTMSKKVMLGKFIIPIMIGTKCFFKRNEIESGLKIRELRNERVKQRCIPDQENNT